MDHLASSASPVVRLRRIHWLQMLNDVQGRVGEEACGLVAGLAGESTHVFVMTNILHSGIRYQLEPSEQFQIFQNIEAQHWNLLAIYHSHPVGPAGLSTSDIEQAYYPEAAYLVWFPAAGSWTCNAYLVRDRFVQQVSIEILDDNPDQ